MNSCIALNYPELLGMVWYDIGCMACDGCGWMAWAWDGIRWYWMVLNCIGGN